MTVTFKVVNGFDELLLDQATNVLYDELIPVCESKQVNLSQYGNHNAWGSLCSVEDYTGKKANQTLFDVERIQRVFSALSTMLVATSTYKTGSYHLKHVVEELPEQEYLTNGDLIAAMLMHGHKARFAKQGESLGVNCEFKVKVAE